MRELPDQQARATLRFMWDTFDQTGASIAASTAGTIEIYKGTSVTKRSSANGITDTRSFNSIVGINQLSIDLSDNTDAGFYAAGYDYFVVLNGAVIDTKTVNKNIAHFSIEKLPPYSAIETSPIAGSMASIINRLPDVAAGGNGGLPTTNGTKLNQTADLTAGQSIACSDKAGFSLSATGADLILKSSTFIQAIVAAINEFATYGLTALNTLLVTTGIKAASIPAATLAASQHVIVDSGTVTAIPNATIGGYAAGQDPVTLMNATPPDTNAKTISDGAVKSTTFTSGAIDSAALATNAIGSDEFTQAAADKVWLTVARSLTSAASFEIKKNTQLAAFPFVMTDSTNHAPMTLATIIATRAIDGGAFGVCSNAVVEIANGWYKITLSAADLNGNTIALRFTAVGADDLNITIVTQA